MDAIKQLDLCKVKKNCSVDLSESSEHNWEF